MVKSFGPLVQRTVHVQLISVAFEPSVLCVWEIYALENAVFYIAVYGPYKPVYMYATRNVQT